MNFGGMGLKIGTPVWVFGFVWVLLDPALRPGRLAEGYDNVIR